MSIKEAHKKPVLTAPKWMQKAFAIVEWISPILASRLAIYLFFTPIRFKAPATEKKVAKQAKRRILKFKNNKIQTYEWGSGESAILLVHGWSGRATQVAHIAKRLNAEGYQVISFDAPAHGYSNGRHTHLMEFGELILRMQEEYPNIEAVIGHSMGGAATVYAILHGFKVNKCVLIGSPASTSWILHSFCEQINVSTKVAELMKIRLEKKFEKEINEISLEEMAKQVDIPALILHDEDDVDAPVESAHRIHKNWKNSKLVLTKKLGHRRILKDAVVAQHIIDFLK